MQTRVRLLFFLFPCFFIRAIKRGSQLGSSSLAFVTEDDGDPSAKTLSKEGLYRPSLSYGVPYTKGKKKKTGACKGHILYKRRHNENKREKTHERAGI